MSHRRRIGKGMGIKEEIKITHTVNRPRIRKVLVIWIWTWMDIDDEGIFAEGREVDAK